MFSIDKCKPNIFYIFFLHFCFVSYFDNARLYKKWCQNSKLLQWFIKFILINEKPLNTTRL